MTVVLGGSLLLALFLAVAPGLPTQGNFLVAVLIIIFGFFFATVSSRITGLIGSSSNPISGMTIATLIITCLIFVALGWTGDVYAPDRALGRRHRLHRRRQRRQHVAGPQDRLHRRRDAASTSRSAWPSASSPRRSSSAGRSLYLHKVFTIGSAAVRGAAGDADGHADPGPAVAEPAVGPGAGRHVHRRHPRAVRHPLAVVRGRLLSADRDDGADLRRRPGALVGGAQDRAWRASRISAPARCSARA